MRILYMHRSLADGGEGVHIRAMIRAFEGVENISTLIEKCGKPA